MLFVIKEGLDLYITILQIVYNIVVNMYYNGSFFPNRVLNNETLDPKFCDIKCIMFMHK